MIINLRTLSNHYEKRFLSYDLLLTIIVNVGLTVAGYWWDKYIIARTISDLRVAIYSTIAATSGALLGFAVAGLSILLGIAMGSSDYPALRLLRQSKHYKYVYGTFLSTSKYLGFLTLASIVALILDRDSRPLWWMPCLIIWSGSICVLRLARCIWVLRNIVDLVIKEGIARKT